MVNIIAIGLTVCYFITFSGEHLFLMLLHFILLYMQFRLYHHLLEMLLGSRYGVSASGLSTSGFSPIFEVFLKNRFFKGLENYDFYEPVYDKFCKGLSRFLHHTFFLENFALLKHDERINYSCFRIFCSFYLLK